LLLVLLPNSDASSSSLYCVPYKYLSLLKSVGRVMYRGMICVGSRLKVQVFPQFKFKIDPERYDYNFGCDPVEDQYKVLAIDAWASRGEHKVLVVGRDRAWREAQCVACPHVSHTSGLYMNGTVYYGAARKDIVCPNSSIIVCFDVRLETFNIIQVPSKVLTSMGYMSMWFHYPWVDTSDNDTDKTLINYRGKIGVVENPRLKGSFRMWVVEDAEKEEWSMSTFHLPESAADGLAYMVMDTFSNGEICLVLKKLSDLFYYYESFMLL
ncbi:hypothetical protein EUTSA_v10011107mg, partial [Eutrema salsugineum]